ncbi:MAG: panthothenate synthetase [Chloroflexi bacterium]|nr:panthothenate synthetase [Chloroflexota bacterium]
MRMLMYVNFPVEPFNTLVKNGTVGGKIQQAMEDTNPEAAYFSEENGERCGVFVVNVSKASEVPTLAEPWFLNFNARIRLRICMTPEDLGNAGLDEIGKKYAN